MTQTGIRIDGVTKAYKNGPRAVDDVSLEVRQGEFMVLVGPSGCGKSTLLKLIAGIEETTAGSIHIGGRDVTHLDPRKRDIAMVFQNYALYPHLSVRANLGFGLKLRKTSKARDRQARRRGGEDPRAWRRCSSASRASSPAASASAWPWAARSCASRRPS